MLGNLLRRGPLLLGIAAGVLFVTPRPAAACSCVALDLTTAVPQADAAVVATLVHQDEPKGEVAADGTRVVSSGEPVDFTFDVESVVKGDVGDPLVVRSANDGASCGIEARPGERVGLLLERRGGEWQGNLCAQSDPDELAAYQSAHPGSTTSSTARGVAAPRPSDPGGGDGGGGGEAGVTAMAVGAAAVAGLTGAAVVRRRRRRVSPEP